MVWDRRPITVLGLYGPPRVGPSPPTSHHRGHHPEAISPSNQALCSLAPSSSPHSGYKKQIKLKQSLLCSWPSNGSHVSQNQIPYKGLTSSTCPFHVSNHFLHSFKHGSSHGSPGCSWPTDTSLPQSLCYCSYSTTCTGVPGYLHGSLLQLRTHMSPSQGNLHWSPTSTLYPFTYIHTTLLSWFIYPPNTYHLFFYIYFSLLPFSPYFKVHSTKQGKFILFIPSP